jgi:hypothetical protein
MPAYTQMAESACNTGTWWNARPGVAATTLRNARTDARCASVNPAIRFRRWASTRSVVASSSSYALQRLLQDPLQELVLWVDIVKSTEKEGWE